jgi:Flp pilus assembly protein TadD
MRFTLVLPLVLAACATIGQQRVRPEPAPAWSSEEGRLSGRLSMAETMLAVGEPERALAALSTARGEVGGSYELDHLQARVFQSLGMVAEALELLEPWGHSRRRDPGLASLLGLLCFDLERLDDAEEHLTRAAALAPDDAEILNNLGFVLLVRERPEQAIPWLRQAVALEPHQQRYRLNLGFALAAAGQRERALAIFRAHGSEPLALARMGVALERADEPRRAAARYQQALEIDPRQPVARAGLERLDPEQETTP